MQFDWYEATLPGADPRAILEALLAMETGTVKVEGRGMRGYDVRASVVSKGGERLGEVWYGGRNGDPHLVSTSDAARQVAPMVRERWPGHRVTRADVCEDFEAPGMFGRLAGKCLLLADDKGIKVQHQGDWHRAEDGRTLRLGGRTSPVIARLYEKGIEMRSRMPDLYQSHMREVFPDDMVRLELQVRPQSREARERAAVMEPREYWGFGAWSASLWERVAGDEVARQLVDKGYRPDDDARAYGWLLASYWRLLERMAEDLGDWACLGKQIGDDIGVMRLNRAQEQARKEAMS